MKIITSEFPAIKPLFKGKRLWKSEEMFTFTVNEQKYFIPAGFEFDGASVPKMFGFYATAMDIRLLRGALVHDWLYTHHHREIPRRLADKILRTLWIQDGIRKSKAWLMWFTVRIFGWKNWYF